MASWKHEEYINWKTTPGVGDFMMGLNVAYGRWGRKRRPVTINFHWYHDKDHYHHCEDSETILERFDYIHSFYYQTGAVKIEHTFNSTNPLEFRFDWTKDGKPLEMDLWNEYKFQRLNTWPFDPKHRLPTDKKKVVLWRAMMNAEQPRLWKRRISNDGWQIIIDHLKELGYNVVELEYKTPISEVTYHINTCLFTISYDGMWHYIAKNFHKPMIVLSDDMVTHFHTVHALRISYRKTFEYCLNLDLTTSIKQGGDKVPSEVSPYNYIMKKSAKEDRMFWEQLLEYNKRPDQYKWSKDKWIEHNALPIQ